MLKTLPTQLADVIAIEPKVFADARGYFFESYKNDTYLEVGIDCAFVQDNISCSSKNVLRGLHYQRHFPQAKLVTVIQGEVFDVAVDIRKNSPTFGQWESIILSEANHKQFFVPAGFAHGFCVLSETAIFHYKCSETYHPEDEQGILWNDATLNINWPLTAPPMISDKDARYATLDAMPPELLPDY